MMNPLVFAVTADRGSIGSGIDSSDSSYSERHRIRKRPAEIIRDDTFVNNVSSDQERSAPRKKSKQVEFEWKEDERIDIVRKQMRSKL